MYEWDDAGNRVKAGTGVYTYDQRNRLLTGPEGDYSYTPRGTLSRVDGGVADPEGMTVVVLTGPGVDTWTPPAGVDSLERVFVVGAGGGGMWGGSSGPGGGGAGEVKELIDHAVTPEDPISFTIGGGGRAGYTGSPQVPAQHGGNTVFDGVTALGGGPGAGHVTVNTPDRDGGSGGGASSSPSSSGAPGEAVGTGWGHDGGGGQDNGPPYAGGGGGGAGQQGEDAHANGAGVGGDGGSGVDLSAWVGTGIGDDGWFAGGGGSAGSNGVGAGGQGGGGTGQSGSWSTASNGLADTGSGGGARRGAPTISDPGGDGADGIIIIVYETPGSPAVDYTFDPLGRLVEVDDGTTVTEYLYDGLDRVAERDTVGFTYQGQHLDPTSDGVHTYSRTPSGRLIAISDGVDDLLAGSDRHGDLTHLFEADGTVTDTASYDPFGDPLHSTGSFGPQVGFQADWTDPATGHVWMGARWYDGGWANFLSRDTVFGELTTPISLNRYTYAFANPLTYWDPDGRFAGVAQHDFGGAAPPKKTSKTATNKFMEANTDPAPNKKTKPASKRAETTVLTQNNRQGNPTSQGLFGEVGHQVGGFFYGLGSGLWGAARGIGEVTAMGYRSSPINLAFNRASFNEQWDVNRAIGRAAVTNPGQFLNDAIVQPLRDIGTPWHQGRQGETLGRAAALGLEILVGGKMVKTVSRFSKTPGPLESTRTASFVAGSDGVVVPASASRMIEGFERAGFDKFFPRSRGVGYVLPDGSNVRIMEPTKYAPLRAAFSDAFDHPISPFTGKPPQPPPGLLPPEWSAMHRMLTHIDLQP